MSERDNMASENRKEPIRKEPRQINFRVSEDEYLKLKQSAETLNMSVPNFVKKKAQGARLVAPKFDYKSRRSIISELSHAGNNIYQIAKVLNANKENITDFERLNRNFEEVRKELSKLWQQLN